MTATKTFLIALGFVFGLASFASAAPRDNTPYNGYTEGYGIAGKTQQDHFTVTN